MLPCNPGGHTAYQDTFVYEFLKYYPDPFALSKDTWDYIVQFWYLDLSPTDSIMQECYSVFGPEPRLPSCMLRSKHTSWNSTLKSSFWILPMMPILSTNTANGTGSLHLFLRAMRKIAMFTWIFDECRKGQYPAALQRCKLDTPLLAAGYLIDLSPGHTGHFTYKDDFTIDEDGVPICKMGLRMHKDGYEAAKHRAKYRCPKANRRQGCFSGHPCSPAKYDMQSTIGILYLETPYIAFIVWYYYVEFVVLIINFINQMLEHSGT